MSKQLIDKMAALYQECGVVGMLTTDVCSQVICDPKPISRATMFVLDFINRDNAPIFATTIRNQEYAIDVPAQYGSSVKSSTTPLFTCLKEGSVEYPMLTFRHHIHLNEDECLTRKEYQLAGSCTNATALSTFVNNAANYFQQLSDGFWASTALQVWNGITTGNVSYVIETPTGTTQVVSYQSGIDSVDYTPAGLNNPWDTMDCDTLLDAIEDLKGTWEDRGCCELATMYLTRTTFAKIVNKLKECNGSCCTSFSTMTTDGIKSVDMIAGIRVNIVPTLSIPVAGCTTPTKLLNDGEILFTCEGAKVEFYDMLNIAPSRLFDGSCDDEVGTGVKTQCEKADTGALTYKMFYNYGLVFPKNKFLFVKAY